MVLRWSVGFVIKRSRVRVSAGIKTLGKFLTPMCLCHQAAIVRYRRKLGSKQARRTRIHGLAAEAGVWLQGYRNGDQRRANGPMRLVMATLLFRPYLHARIRYKVKSAARRSALRVTVKLVSVCGLSGTKWQ